MLPVHFQETSFSFSLMADELVVSCCFGVMLAVDVAFRPRRRSDD